MPDGSTTVLLVDDEPRVLNFMCTVLERAGYRVLSGKNYGDAVQLFGLHSTEIDLLIIDISLSDKNGLDIAAELKETRPALQTLFISGSVGAELLHCHGLSGRVIHNFLGNLLKVKHFFSG